MSDSDAEFRLGREFRDFADTARELAEGIAALPLSLQVARGMVVITRELKRTGHPVAQENVQRAIRSARSAIRERRLLLARLATIRVLLLKHFPNDFPRLERLLRLDSTEQFRAVKAVEPLRTDLQELGIKAITKAFGTGQHVSTEWIDNLPSHPSVPPNPEVQITPTELKVLIALNNSPSSLHVESVAAKSDLSVNTVRRVGRRLADNLSTPLILWPIEKGVRSRVGMSITPAGRDQLARYGHRS